MAFGESSWFRGYVIYLFTCYSSIESCSSNAILESLSYNGCLKKLIRSLFGCFFNRWASEYGSNK